MEKRPSSGPNLDALDGVRGLAVLLVIASHARALGLEAHGAVGVWLFFGLSAFLLTLPFARRPERVAEPRELRHYAARRLLRILPPYYLFLLAWPLVAHVRPRVLLQHALFLRGDMHLWSIPQEMFFYLLLPVFAAAHLFAFRRNLAATVAGLLALALASALWLDASVFAFDTNGRPQRFFLSVFLCGMAAAYAWHSPALSRRAAQEPANRILHAVGLGLLALLILSARSFQMALARVVPALESLGAPLGWVHPGAFGLLSAALIYATLACPGRPLHRLMASLPLRALGLVSYSVYLLHVPVLRLLRDLGVPEGSALAGGGLALSYALACISYTLVERPFLRIGEAPRMRARPA